MKFKVSGVFKKNSFLVSRKKLLFVAFLIIVAVSLGTKYLFFSKSETLQTAFVKKGDIKQELSLSGKIDAQEHVNLAFQTSGLLAWVGVKEGDRVNKFQGIASLDVRQLKKTLDKTLNDYLKTRWDFEQTKDDHKDDIITDKIKRILEKSQFDLNNSVLDVEIQSLAIELANLYTPIEGIVTHVDSPVAGMNVYTPSQSQFEIINPSTIYFDVNADQTEVVPLKGGQKGTIVLDAYPEEKIAATISNISFTPKIDESGTVYKVKVVLNLPNSNYKYRLGMTGDITFIANEIQNTLYLPITFVKSDNEKKYVLLGKEKKKTSIKTGLETDTNVEILDGLNEGDLVYD